MGGRGVEFLPGKILVLSGHTDFGFEAAFGDIYENAGQAAGAARHKTLDHSPSFSSYPSSVSSAAAAGAGTGAGTAGAFGTGFGALDLEVFESAGTGTGTEILDFSTAVFDFAFGT